MSDEKRNVEMVNAHAMQTESRQVMKRDISDLKKKMSGILGDQRSAKDALTEALTGAAHNIASHAVQDMYNGNMGNPVANVAQNGMHESRNPYAASGMHPVVHGDWQPVQILKETSIGKEVETYRVRNRNTKERYDYEFRNLEVAEMVSAALNESNDYNDPRIRKIVEYCNKEHSLLLETSKLVKQYKGLDQGNVKRRGIVRNKISENKLMLEGIRSKLGIV